MTEVKEDKKEKMATLELSTAAKARARAKAKATASGEMDVDSAGKAGGAEEEGKKDKAKTEEVVKEADSYTLANPVRIAPAQAKFVRLPTRASGQRFVQLSASTRTTGGVIMLLDTRGSEALPAAEGGDATVRAIRAPTTGQAEEKEAPQPKPFEWEIGQYADEPAAAAGEPAGK
jgi:26S proteasome regulatory subunit N2